MNKKKNGEREREREKNHFFLIAIVSFVSINYLSEFHFFVLFPYRIAMS